MASHGPYIMPDGRSLAQYLRTEKLKVVRLENACRGKDEHWNDLISNKSHLEKLSDFELAEQRALESVGARRRRRWLNEKTLRDMAGPMTYYDMEAQFNPVPFGFESPETPLTQIRRECPELWSHFTNIHPDKEAKVLKIWEQKLRDERRPKQLSSAAQALKRWSAINKKARAVLKRANPQSVFLLEQDVLPFLSRGPSATSLILPAQSPLTRILLHGIAEYHDLLAHSKLRIQLNWKQTSLLTQACPPVEKEDEDMVMIISWKKSSVPDPSQEEAEQVENAEQIKVRSQILSTYEYNSCVTCADVLFAIAEAGQLGLTEQAMQQYINSCAKRSSRFDSVVSLAGRVLMEVPTEAVTA